MDKYLAHILVVDDDNRIRELVKQYLLESKYLVTTAKDAFDAKNKIEIITFSDHEYEDFIAGLLSDL